MLTSVKKGSVLEDSGLRVGDRIDAIGGEEPLTKHEINRCLRHARGSPTTIKFRRGDEYRESYIKGFRP